MPPFEVAYSAKVPGIQTTHLAEFLAIIKAISLSYSVEVVADSAYARGLVQKIIEHPVAKDYVKQCTFDLIMLLITLLTTGPQRQITIGKIRSHQDINNDLDDQQLLDWAMLMRWLTCKGHMML